MPGRPVGRRGSWWRVLVAASALLLAGRAEAHAQTRFALIVSGASGGPAYAEQYERWVRTLAETLAGPLAFDPDHLFVLGETADPDRRATAANVRRLFRMLRGLMREGDLLLVVLIGHGTFDGVDAKFNLVGPDLEAADWASLLDDLPGRLVIVNTASSSFPFLHRLAAPGRIVVSATDSDAQRFDTVFPEYFVGAFADDGADIDKNGRISIWEAFAAAAGGVRRHYQERGQLATERALLDDTGDGVGREAAAQGEDGALASRIYLTPPDATADPTDEVLVDLLQRRASLHAEVEELQIKRVFMPPGEYAREFERVMLALAKLNREIRARSKS